MNTSITIQFTLQYIYNGFLSTETPPEPMFSVPRGNFFLQIEIGSEVPWDVSQQFILAYGSKTWMMVNNFQVSEDWEYGLGMRPEASALVSCYRLKFDLAVKWNRSNVVTPKISASGNFPLLWGTETRTACPPYGTALHLQPDTVSQANTTNQNEHLSTAKGEWRVLRKFIVFFAIFCPTVVKPFKHQQYFPIVCTNRKQT